MQKSEEMKFRLTALLRREEESADTYQLVMKKNGQLAKQIDKGQLPFWVI